MAKIIPFNTNNAYAKVMDKTIIALEQMEADVLDTMVNLATEGKWRQWSEEQPIGTTFTFTEEALRDTGDENVDLLCELVCKIIEIRENFNEQLNVQQQENKSFCATH
ncbi:hypothetical protein AGMMS4957_06500 [Bacteroidia bacterium]|nr:hypothetical protein AGMMS4957_06500 [Bacteroidia bacterium]